MGVVGRRTAIFLLLVLVVLLVASGCGGRPALLEDTRSSVTTAFSEPEALEPRDTSNRMVIKSASLTVVVDDLNASFQELVRVAEENKGFVQDSRMWERDRTPFGSLTLRVPAEHFVNLLEQVEILGRVKDRHFGGQDVTEEYMDQEARLRNLERQEQRYLAILEQAKTVEDVLKIEKELVRVREQVEVLTGHLTRLEYQVSFATINVELREEKGLSEIASPSFPKAFASALQAMVNSFNFILTAITGLIVLIGYLLPLLPFIILGVYLYRRKVLRRGDKG